MWHAYVDSHVGSGDENELETRVGDESGPFKSSRTKLTQSQELGDETGYFADLIYPTCYQSNTLFAWLISHQPAVLFSQNKPTTSNQPTVFFSQNKPAPAISHQPNEQAANFCRAIIIASHRQRMKKGLDLLPYIFKKETAKSQEVILKSVPS
jgi:hypothetical protein